MLIVKLKEGDSFESAMRKFKRMVDKARVLQELRLREFHLNNSVIKQRRKAAAKKRLLKKLAREKMIFKDAFRGHSNHNVSGKTSKDKENRNKENN